MPKEIDRERMGPGEDDSVIMVPPPMRGESSLSQTIIGPPPEGPGAQLPLEGPEDVRGLAPMLLKLNPQDVFPAGPPPKISSWQRFSRVFFGRKVVLISMIAIILLVLMAIFAPFIAPYPPNEPFQGPALSQPSAEHWFGTDSLGRDTLSRVIYGARVSLLIGLSVVIISSVIGIFLGLLAGYYRWAYSPIMRVMDALMAFPMVILMMTIAALMGGGVRNAIIALSVGMIPGYVRVMCGMVLQAKENDYVLALRSVGARHSRILFSHILPNCMQPFIVLMTMQLGAVVAAEGGLSFLGVGVKPPTSTWGSLIADGRPYLLSNPMLCLGAAVALMIVVYCFNMVGDGLRDALDPRLRGTI
jgi:peptide/nickel transport system permease protein